MPSKPLSGPHTIIPSTTPQPNPQSRTKRKWVTPDGVTVRRALQIGGLKRARAVAGLAGLDMVIKYVDIMEVPDFHAWLRPNELIITCAYAIKDDPAAQVNLVRFLARSGATGLAVKPGRFLGTMPEGMIRAADEEGLPLIEIPVDLPFIEITHPLLSAILNEEVQEVRHESQSRRDLTELLIRQPSVESVARALSGVLSRGVAILDDRGNLVARSDAFEDPDDHNDSRVPSGSKMLAERARAIALKASSRDPRRNGAGTGTDTGIVVYPVRAPVSVRGDSVQVQGFIAIGLGGKGPLSPDEVTAVERAAAVTGLELSVVRDVRETKQRLMNEFLAEALAGTPSKDVLDAKVSAIGIDLEQPFMLMAIGLDDARFGPGVAHGGVVTGLGQADSSEWTEPARSGFWNQLEAAIREEARARGVKTALSHYGLGLVVLYMPQGKGSTMQDWGAGRIQEICKKQSISIGVSRTQTGVFGIAEGYRQAALAFKLRGINGRPQQVTTYEEVSAYALLQNLSQQQLASFWAAQVGELAESDNHVLLTTLRAYLQCGGDAKEAAGRLFIHRNTMGYRLKSIEKKLCCNVKDPAVQFRLRIGLTAGILSGRMPAR